MRIFEICLHVWSAVWSDNLSVGEFGVRAGSSDWVKELMFFCKQFLYSSVSCDQGYMCQMAAQDEVTGYYKNVEKHNLIKKKKKKLLGLFYWYTTTLKIC